MEQQETLLKVVMKDGTELFGTGIDKNVHGKFFLRYGTAGIRSLDPKKVKYIAFVKRAK